MKNNILVFLEQREGAILPASLQLLTLAKQLADTQGGKIYTLLIGGSAEGASNICAAYGSQHVFLADDPSLETYSPQAYSHVIQDAIARAKARTLLLAATARGCDVAPRIAARLDGALATDCVHVSAHDDNALRIQRPSYGGKCLATLELAADKLRVLSVRPNTYAMPEPTPTAAVETERLTPTFDTLGPRTVTLETIESDSTHQDIAEADIIVAGGQALGSQENFAILEKLAEVLGGAVGASRAAVDAGFQPRDRQIGLTGKVVSPRLYIACGIDGAIQHLAGMRTSRVIVAINTKADAPIFSVATYGCVADLFELVPLLTAECKRLLATEHETQEPHSKH